MFDTASDAPKLIFPPHGSVLALDDTLPVKVKDGKPPFTWLANGVPIVTGIHRRDTLLPVSSKGFSHVLVIDAEGRASRVEIELR